LGARQRRTAIVGKLVKTRGNDCRQRVVTIPSGDIHKFAMSALPPKADIGGVRWNVR
jgi:hypothetical protein